MQGNAIISPASYAVPGTVYLTQDGNFAVTLQPKAGANASVPLTVKGLAGQTADLLDVRDGSSNLLSYVTALGRFGVQPNPAIASGSAASSIAVSATVISQNTTGGTDETIAAAGWEAQQFNSGVYTNCGYITLQLKLSAAVLANDAINVSLLNDNAGVPGTIFRAAQITREGRLSAAGYLTVVVGLGGALTAGNNYWIAVNTASLSGGAQVIWNSRTDTGTNVVATSPDGVTWTLAGGTKTLVYTVYTPMDMGLSVIAGSSTGVNITTNIGAALSATSITGSGVSATSSQGIGGALTSTYSIALTATSTWSTGISAVTLQGSVYLGSQGGTMLANSSAAAFSLSRTVATNTFTHSGVMFYMNDNPNTSGGGSVTGGLMQLQVATADVLNLSRIGALIQTFSDATTITTTVMHTMQHKTSGTPGTNFGSGFKWQLHSSNNTMRDAGEIDVIWLTATDAAQTSAFVFKTTNAGAALAEAFRIAPGAITLPDAANLVFGTTTGTKIGTATTQKIGFYNATPVARQAATAAAVDATTTQTLANGIRSFLITIGLWA